MPGLIIAAPASGSGKTTITLGLLRALRDRKVTVRGAKSGPDYIDPKFHEAACGQVCVNLDAWAMSPDRIKDLAAGDDLLIIEGAMGLFDGAPPDGKGAVADLARQLELPVILVLDASHMAQSVAPMVAGFARHDPSVRVAGVIFNKVGSPKHSRILHKALSKLGIPVLGTVMRNSELATPSRHLGLVQAQEHDNLEALLDAAAAQVSEEVDVDSLLRLSAPLPKATTPSPVPPNRRHIAIASDRAFAFCYPHLIREWVQAGMTLSLFSPLANDRIPAADVIFLPGGYPELHAATLAKANNFIDGLRSASQNTDIYGECGGYMALGESLTDADGTLHEMAGLLPLQTSFAKRKLHLGYRDLSPHQSGGKGPFQGHFKGHEFHYATTLKADGTPLFDAKDAEGNALPPMGLVKGRVSGSFAHIIDRALP